MKKILIFIVLFSAVFFINTPKADAMDPVTIGILAPYALPYAEAAGMYAIKGLANAAGGMGAVFKDMVGVFMLPVGVLECTLGIPFGLFSNGVDNVVTGVESPFKLAFSTFMLIPRLFLLTQ